MNETPPPDDSAPVEARPVAFEPFPRTASVDLPFFTKRHDMTLPHLGQREAWFDLTLVLLATILLPYLPLVVIPFIDNVENARSVSRVGPYEITRVWLHAALAAGLLFYFVKRIGVKPAGFGVRFDHLPMQLAWSGAALIGVYAAMFLTALVVMGLLLFFPAWQDDLTERIEYIDKMPLNDIGVTLILLIAVAINEEVVFRGLLIPYLRRVCGSWWLAGLISSAIFASLHVPDQGLLGGGIQIFAVGVMLAAFFILSRSLLAVTIAHFLFNLFQFQFARMLPDLEKLLENMPAG